jgi:hypothetical protein
LTAKRELAELDQAALTALAHTSSFEPTAASSNEDMIRHVAPFFFPETAHPSPRREQAKEQVCASWSAIGWAHHQRLGALTRIDVPAAAALVKAPRAPEPVAQPRICHMTAL